jgi:uncharacterized membrane protein
MGDIIMSDKDYTLHTVNNRDYTMLNLLKFAVRQIANMINTMTVVFIVAVVYGVVADPTTIHHAYNDMAKQWDEK